MNILIKTAKGNDYLKAALDQAAKVPPDFDDNWPYVLEQPSERFIYVKKQGPLYRIGLYARGIGIRPRLMTSNNFSPTWAPLAEFVAYVSLIDDGVAIKVRLKRSTLILYGLFYLLVLGIFFYGNPFSLIFAFIFIALSFPFLYSELKKGRKYFIERVTEYIGSL